MINIYYQITCPTFSSKTSYVNPLMTEVQDSNSWDKKCYTALHMTFQEEKRKITGWRGKSVSHVVKCLQAEKDQARHGWKMVELGHDWQSNCMM